VRKSVEAGVVEARLSQDGVGCRPKGPLGRGTGVVDDGGATLLD
jgi:hypothetical protein